MSLLTFDERLHEYRIDGRTVPSVTQVLRPLVEWSLGSLDTPSMEAARIRGQHVHAACQYDDEGDLDLESIGSYAGYVEAWRNFRRREGAEVVLNEQRVANPGMGYAGTLDRMVWWRGQLWLIDLKTGEWIPAYDVQLSAYLMAVLDMGLGCGAYTPTVSTRRATITLNNDGTYTFTEATRSLQEDYSVFVAALRIDNWRKQWLKKL